MHLFLHIFSLVLAFAVGAGLGVWYVRRQKETTQQDSTGLQKLSEREQEINALRHQIAQMHAQQQRLQEVGDPRLYGHVQELRGHLEQRNGELHSLRQHCQQVQAQKDEEILRLRQQLQHALDQLQYGGAIISDEPREGDGFPDEAVPSRARHTVPPRRPGRPAFVPLDSLVNQAAQPAPAQRPEPQVAQVQGVEPLTEIRGISPEIQHALYSLGITSLEQIARWSKADVRRIGERLGLASRIMDENWVLQAQTILFERHQRYGG